MAGQQAEHSERDVLRLCGGQHFFDEVGIFGLVVLMKDNRVNSKAYSIAMLLTASCGGEALVERCGARLEGGYGFVGVERPGDDSVAVRLDGEQIVDVGAFGQEHKICFRESGEKGDELSCKVCNVVKSKRVEHLTHIEGGYTCRGGNGFSDLPEHSVIVDVDFDEGRVAAVDEGEIAVCAVVGTSVGYGDELVVWTAADISTEVAVEAADERRGSAQHKSSFACDECLAGDDVRWRLIPLVVDYGDICRWEHCENPAGIGMVGYLSPQQYCFGFEFSGCVQLENSTQVREDCHSE